MIWSEVIAFIQRHTGGRATGFVGVTQSEIDRVQAQLHIVLPSIYVDFLRTMGENSAGLYPFGETYRHTFSELADELPPEDYPAERFFKVAFAIEELSVDLIDAYLDLSRSDGDDAPLVKFETPFKPTSKAFSEDYLHFGERLVFNIFRRLEADRRKFRASIAVFGPGASNGTGIKEDALRLLTGLGFTAALPDRRRVGCVTGESASALIAVSEGKLVRVTVDGDTREAVEDPIRVLLNAFPDAQLVDPPKERSGRAGS